MEATQLEQISYNLQQSKLQIRQMDESVQQVRRRLPAACGARLGWPRCKESKGRSKVVEQARFCRREVRHRQATLQVSIAFPSLPNSTQVPKEGDGMKALASSLYLLNICFNSDADSGGVRRHEGSAG